MGIVLDCGLKQLILQRLHAYVKSAWKGSIPTLDPHNQADQGGHEVWK